MFYKLSIYKGMTVQAVAAYTFIYFGSVLVFAFSLVLRQGYSLSDFFPFAMSFFFGLCAIVFGGSVFQTGSIMLFLSFSSLLNLFFMSLQLS